MLKGQISIVGLDNLAYTDRFTSLFDCDLDKIDCALMTIGIYGQQERNLWRFQFGSKSLQIAWDELFHKSGNIGFDKTKDILIKLLSTNATFSNSILSGIISDYITACETNGTFPWNYYYVKYPVFRPGSFGKLSNSESASKPYLYSIMQTKTQWSQNTYMPYLKEADDAHLSKDSLGQRLVYSDVYIVCENDSYVIHSLTDDSIVNTLAITQNEDGIDTEDRIVKLKAYIANI